MEERINELESQLCFQDQTLEELNTLLTDQQKQIDHLTSQINNLKQLFSVDEADIVDIALEVPPPHY